MNQSSGLPGVVLVHGGFVDGSGWSEVYKVLKRDGYDVRVAQNSTVSLTEDVETVEQVLSEFDKPVILVGHSYGGAVITEVGANNKVAGLVYIAAFAPDDGESLDMILKSAPPGASAPPILPPQNGFLFLDRSKFHAAFAADLNAEQAEFMGDSQVPWGVSALNQKVTKAAWRSKPSWYLVASEDKMIPPDAQRSMAKRCGATTAEAKGSHAIYVSQPRAVASIIMAAAEKLKTTSRSTPTNELRA